MHTERVMNMTVIITTKDGKKTKYKNINEIYESERRKEILLETIEYEHKILIEKDIKEIKIDV